MTRVAAVRVLLAGLLFAFAPASAQARAPAPRAPIAFVVAPSARAVAKPTVRRERGIVPRARTRRPRPARRVSCLRTWPRARLKAWLFGHALLR